MQEFISRLKPVLQWTAGMILLFSLYYIHDWGPGRCSNVEEFRVSLLQYAGAGSILGIVTGMIIYDRGLLGKSQYLLNMAIRYFLAFLLIYFGLYQILDLIFPQSLSALELKVAEMSSSQLAYTFFSHTYFYQAFIGWLQLIGCFLLFYRASTPLGLLILSAILTNVLMIQFQYGMCNAPQAGICLGSVVYLMLPYMRNLVNSLLLNKETAALSFPLFDISSHGYKAVSILKLVFIIGITIFYYNKSSRYYRYYRSNEESPIVGVWKINSFSVDSAYSEMEYEDLPNFERLYLDKFRLGAVKAQDSISYFEYMVDTTYHQLEFWNFHQFRELDLKGKYKLTHPDTLIYNGMNRTDSIQMVLTRDKNYRVR